ncbi:MAG: hypothetical protein K0Q95_598 [Bacteroidota bacterium]|jgi:hypothetical protein|nr:hypothetical protein [Bacteroidota bacterium]
MTSQINKVLFLFFFLSSNVIYSQTSGVEFAPNNTHWSQVGMYRISFSTMNFVYENDYIKGDTIINNKYCQKIYTSNSQYFDTTCMQFSRYIYYNNRRLYTDSAVSIDTNSILLYDFNLNAGDTFNLFLSEICPGHNGYYKLPVDHTDSMFYGGRWRKRIVFETLPGFYFGSNPITWVEGIGDIDHGLSSTLFKYAWGGYGLYGGMRNFYGQIEQCYCNNGLTKLNCFQEPGYATYGTACSLSNCATAVNEINDHPDIYIFPNPTSEALFIENSYDDILELRLLNTVGSQVVEMRNIKSRNVHLTLGGLNNGVYILEVKTDKRVLTEKIIVLH